MADPFVLELVDRLSKPADRAADALERIEKAIEHADHGMQKHEKHHEGFRHALFETVEIAKEVGTVLFELGEKAIEFGKEILEAAGFTERAHVALDTLLGSSQEAAELMERLEVVAPKLGLAAKDLTIQATELINAGFKPDDLKEALAAANDIGALNLTNPGATGEGIAMLAHIQDTGKLTERAIKQLKSLHISIPDVTDALAKQYGVKTSAVAKLVKDGKIDADHGLAAIYTAIAKKQGGVLGTASEKLGQTVPGMLNALKNTPDSIFESLAGSEGYAKFRGFLANVVELVSPDSDFGKRIRVGIGKVADKLGDVLFGGLSGPDGQKKIEHALDSVMSQLELLPGYIEDTKAAWKDLTETAGVVVDVFTFVKDVFVTVGEFLGVFAGEVYLEVEHLSELPDHIAAVFMGMYDKLTDAGADLIAKAVEIGTGIWQGIKDGLTDGIGAVTDAVSDMGHGIVDNLKGLLGIHSPSTVFAEMGRQSGAGFAEGIADSADAIDASYGTMPLPDISPSVSGGAVSRGGASVTVGDIYVTVGSGSASDARAIAVQIKESLMSELGSAFEELAMQQGVG